MAISFIARLSAFHNRRETYRGPSRSKARAAARCAADCTCGGGSVVASGNIRDLLAAGAVRLEGTTEDLEMLDVDGVEITDAGSAAHASWLESPEISP